MSELPMDLSAIPTHSRFFGNVHHLDSVDSTNQYARDLLRAGAGRLLVIAEVQTHGRGRQGRTWMSPRHKGLWMTLVAENKLDVTKTFLYTFGTALVIAESIETVCGVTTNLKWPNDVLIDQQKVSGILIEIVDGNVLLGVGINCNQQTFPDDLRDQAVSLRQVTGAPVSREALLNEILNRFERAFDRLRLPLITTWKSKSLMFGKEIRVQEGDRTYHAVAVDISEDGGLIISRNEKTSVLYAADVKILRNADHKTPE